MRKLISSTILSLFTVGSFAQTTLTSKNNSLIAGESATYKTIQNIEPGNTGPNQVWDFSKIVFTEKNMFTSFQSVKFEKLQSITSANLSIIDDGYNYIMRSNENILEELGYENQTKNMTMTYSDPIVKMQYPFSFGNQFTDDFAGTALFSDNYKIEFTGKNAVSADAYGTMILPDQILENVMRVKSVKSGIQINPCGQVKVNIVKYAWYAEGSRYPVMIINRVENTYNNSLAPEITTTTTVCLPQPKVDTSNPITQNSGGRVTTNASSNVDVTLFPNPYSQKITYNYHLKSDMPVSIMLYDITGKHNQLIADNQLQSAGFQSGTIDDVNHHLPAGVYYLRFVFGEQVVVQKFVKIEAQ